MTKISVGDRIRLEGSHPFAGHVGDIVGFEYSFLIDCIVYRVYIEDQKQEVYFNENDEIAVIEPGNCHYDIS